MKILFLGDIIGISGCSAVEQYLPEQIKKNRIDFVIVNGENCSEQGVGITEKIANNLFSCGVNVITSGNHIWDQKETANHIEKEDRLLRPHNSFSPAPGKGFQIFTLNDGLKIGILNLMGNVFMKKSENVFEAAKKFLQNNQLKKDYDFLILDFHAETTSEKMAMGHFFDGKATLVVGTHTHVPTNDARILENGTAYQTDAGMSGNYNSVIGMDKNVSIKRFLKENVAKNFPTPDNITLCGVIVEADLNTGLAKNIQSFIYGGELKNSH
jgi:metallophosphoesterase (TIGR00282 family)|tara:strand:+ start:352 stop:1158 length:807 start_codon:yes stop_codon:yes gene_type:complete